MHKTTHEMIPVITEQQNKPSDKDSLLGDPFSSGRRMNAAVESAATKEEKKKSLGYSLLSRRKELPRSDWAVLQGFEVVPG
ncbi:hypothetical protein N7513_003176 [Penicillium frequentans]|nr:hypothetical protein N7513_003176 [Penicillium glabrum]